MERGLLLDQDMKIGHGIVTVNRPGGFIYPMIGSMVKTGFFSVPENLPLHLCVGNTDAAYLSRYQNHGNPIIVSPMTKEQVEEWKFDTISRGARCSLGHYWCMKRMLQDPALEGILVFEDDVEFAAGWIRRLNETLDDIRKNFGQKWILTLYSPEYEVKIHYDRKDLWFPLQKKKFFGSQALLYPRAIAEDLLPMLEDTIREGRLATDMVVAKYTMDRDVPLLSTTPCLVQHMGNISVGCNPEAITFHRAGCFIDSI